MHFLLFFSTFSVSHTPETLENYDESAVALQAPLPRFCLAYFSCLHALQALQRRQDFLKKRGGGWGGFYFCMYSMVESIYLLCLVVSRLKGVLVI